MRNVSSSNRLKADGEEELPPPARLAGDTIRFDRCLVANASSIVAPILNLTFPGNVCHCKQTAGSTVGRQLHCGAA
jgi:hypothetical protein